MKTKPEFNFKPISEIDLNQLSDDKWYVVSKLNSHRQVAHTGAVIKRIKDKIECVDITPIEESPWAKLKEDKMKQSKLKHGKFYIVKVDSTLCESGYLIMKYDMGYLECEHTGHILKTNIDKYEIVTQL